MILNYEVSPQWGLALMDSDDTLQHFRYSDIVLIKENETSGISDAIESRAYI